MAHTINIETTGNAMAQYCVKHGKTLNQTLKQGLEFDNMLTKVSCDAFYEGKDGEISDLLQAYQSDFTPNNVENFDGTLNRLEYGKVDLQFTWKAMETWFDKYACNWFEAGKPEATHSYPAYVMNQLVAPKLIEEINLCSWNGIHVPPTPGVAGPSLGTYTGFGKRIADMLSLGKLVAIPTGVFTDSTMEAQIRDFCKQVPLLYRFKKGKIFMSKSNALRYAEDVENKHPNRKVSEEKHDQMYLRVDKFNKMIVGLDSMEGSDRIILVFDNQPSLILGRRKGYSELPNFRVHVKERALHVITEMPRFYGFETLKHIFVNDQP